MTDTSESGVRPSKELALLTQIREDCKQVGFDWPSNDTVRSGPPERVIYSGDAIRNAAWHRSKLLRMLDERDAEIARLKANAHETGPCAERQDAYDAAAAVAVEKINKDAARYRVVRVSKLISESIAPWDLDAACDEWIAKANAAKASEPRVSYNSNGDAYPVESPAPKDWTLATCEKHGRIYATWAGCSMCSAENGFER